MPDAKIKLVGDSDYHYDPILLKSPSSKIYLYCPTSSEKEDWFCKLARCRKLPNGFNQDKVMEFYRDLEPVRAYESGMQKLQETLKDLDSDSPVWLNALLGRAFISIHSNPRIKLWIMENITKRMAHVHRTSTSFLGDIIIKDLDVGNSLPIISNPHLLAISNEGDMEIELDLDYTGGKILFVKTRDLIRSCNSCINISYSMDRLFASDKCSYCCKSVYYIVFCTNASQSKAFMGNKSYLVWVLSASRVEA
jgi:hypothetical protein